MSYQPSFLAALPPGTSPRYFIVRLGSIGYPIIIFYKALAAIPAILPHLVTPYRVLILTDSNVRVLYGESLAHALRAAAFHCRLLEVPAGESSKTLGQLPFVYDTLAAWGGSRDVLILALGGGVVGDLAGFVAATWLRGVPLVMVPTTLEAAIDAAVGGKNALNHPAGKNLIGTFHQPAAVIVDPECFASLPDRDLRAGLAESVKHAVIRDPAFFAWQEASVEAILARSPAAMPELLERNCRIKAHYVEADERETTGVRTALNFGHTIGHAIEAQLSLVSGGVQTLRHGECVALGMIAANEIAVRHLGLARAEADRIRVLLERLGLPTRAPGGLTVDAVCRRMFFDKKRGSVGGRFVLCPRIGEARLIDDVPEHLVRSAVAGVLEPSS